MRNGFEASLVENGIFFDSTVTSARVGISLAQWVYDLAVALSVGKILAPHLQSTVHNPPIPAVNLIEVQ